MTALQYGWGLGKFGGHEYMMRVVLLSALRSLGPGVAGSALLTAYVVWAAALPRARLEAELPRFLKRGLLVSGPGYVVAAAVAIAGGALVSYFGYGVSGSVVRGSVHVVGAADVGYGLYATLLDTALIVLLASRFLLRLQAGQRSLPMQLIIAWTFVTGLRLTVALLGSMLVPG
ncbi:MAG TPA: hypothetical protein VHP33_41595 [Polyangiaceae bacterium]|nr:hypothetical protein [Polyangiaceae bacterium]